MPEIPDKQWFRPDEVAELINIPLRNVYFWIQRDRIEHVRFGGRIRISHQEVERIVRQGLQCGKN